MQGGLHPDLKIEWYEDLLRSIKQRFPISLALSLGARSREHRRSQRPDDCATRSRGCATPDSIQFPGGGAEILDDDVRRRISRLKCSVQEWVDVHRTAHELGMRTTATMMFGTGETLEQRMNHLELIRNLQGNRRIHGVHPSTPSPNTAHACRSAISSSAIRAICCQS